jgi:transposase
MLDQKTASTAANHPPRTQGVIRSLVSDPLRVTLEEFEEFLGRVKERVADSDYHLIKSLVFTLRQVTEQLNAKNASLERLRRILFGSGSEKTRKVTGRSGGGSGSGTESDKPAAGADGSGTASPGPTGSKNSAGGKSKCKGHGRNPASAYTGATRIRISHATLHKGDICPGCSRGRLSRLDEPAQIVRVVGQPCLSATIWSAERLRCGACGEVFTAELPPEARGPKYDVTAGSMLALLRYGSGVPGARLEQHQSDLGVPVPESVQYEVVSEVAAVVGPVFDQLLHEAAQRDVVHNDDTGAKILEHGRLVASEPATKGKQPRTGTFTTSIVARGGGPDIALFFTGRKHAGENLLELLRRRLPDLGPPIQMCDALNRNYPDALKTLLAKCLAHGRRKFVEVASCFPGECQHVLETLAVVYRNDAEAKRLGLTPDARLEYHRENSAPAMEDLHRWFKAQFDEKRIEPNSTLGQAISYMLTHWPEMTLFLKQAGAPLDNNVCERALKMAILYRKNSLFYKTDAGAAVGDLMMSLIYTCRLVGANPFKYLTELQNNAEHLRQDPRAWLPWTYTNTLSIESG